MITIFDTENYSNGNVAPSSKIWCVEKIDSCLNKFFLAATNV